MTQDPVLVDLLSRPGDLIGTAGDDSIRGGKGSQAIFGLAGDDRLEARDGSDILVGGAGNDTMKSDRSNPTIFYFGTEQKNGIVEVDTIENYREGVDAIDLGGGSIVSVSETRGETVLTLAGDGDQIVLNRVSGVDALSFLDAVPNRSTVPGTDSGTDTTELLPGLGDVAGTGHGEAFAGGAGGDRLFDLGGSDRLHGGAGNGKLYGDSGADVLVFQGETHDGSIDHDAILDYEAHDAIRLVDTSVGSFEGHHDGIHLALAGDCDEFYVRHIYSMDDLTFA